MTDGAPEEIVLPADSNAAYAALMDALAPEEGEPAAGAAGADGAAAPGAPAGEAGAGAAAIPPAPAPPAQPAGADLPTAGDTAPAAQPDGAGAAGADAGAGGAEAPGGAADRPGDWTAAAADVIPKLGELTTAIETNTSQAYQATALEEVQKEHPKYFEALNQHPRSLVGLEVPNLKGDGAEVLRDANDAREWQDAVKHLLVQEVRTRASKAMDENATFLQTVHASVALFQDNPDLIPGTKEFDVDLANRFAVMATPYELRVDGKLQGYSIPVQPLIEQLRNQIVAEREKAAAAAPPAAPPAPAAPAAPAAEPPQAGISSKAGSGDASEDFSTLFGTISPELANIRF